MAGELTPGASETIQVGVELPGHANSEKNTRIEVRTGDPEVTVADCVLSARCPAPFQVTPAFISFGSLAKEDLAKASHDVRLDSVEGQPSLNAESLLIKHANDAFHVERAGSPAAGSFSLRIGIEGDLPPGDLHDTLELRLGGSDQAMRVSLHATLVEAISVVPGTVILRTNRDSESFRSVQLLVTARAGRELPGAVSLADAPHGVHIDDLGEVAAGRRRLRLSVTGDVDGWPRESQVWLRSGRDGERFGFKLVKPTSS